MGIFVLLHHLLKSQTKKSKQFILSVKTLKLNEVSGEYLLKYSKSIKTWKLSTIRQHQVLFKTWISM